MVGRNISHYQIVQKLGAGGMGEIYKAQDMKLNRAVAVKILSPVHEGSGERKQRFVQEAQAASALNHPNIITIHDILSTDEGEVIVMEYVSGKTLSDLIPAGGLSMSLVLTYGAQIASALEAAHAAGIVHRDLKPGNVMVTDNGLVKVLDFGLAKLVAPTGEGVSLADETQTFTGGAALTVEGSILGTVSYMSPEQAEGKPVDARSDIFAFGAMLHEMVTGERAFTGDSTISTLSSILRDPVRPLTHQEGVPPALQNVVEKCLRKKREERWQSVREVRDALMVLKRDSESGTLFLKAPVVPPKKKSQMPLIAAGAGVLVLLAGGGAWFALRPKPAKPPAPVAVQAPPPAPVQTAQETAPAVPVPTPETAPPPVAETPAPPPKKSEPPQRTAKSTKPVTQAAVPATSAPVTITPSAPVTATAAPAPSVPAPAPAPAAPALQTVVVSDGMPISIKLAEDVPADAPADKPIRFTVSREFRIGNNVVLPEGAVINGVIVDAAHKKLIGGTKMSYRLKEADIPGGAKLTLRASSTKQGEDNRRPLEIPGAKHAKDVAATAGSNYVAYVDGDQTVTVKPVR